MESIDYINSKIKTIKMAGIMFTDKNLVLAGYNKLQDHITGFGGKKKREEKPYETALRETIEEMFEIYLSDEQIKEICNKIVFDNLIAYKSYSLFIMSFNDLEYIINILKSYNLKSKIYEEFPNNISDLILKRKYYDRCEFDSIIIIPYSYEFHVKPELLKDILTFKNTVINNI